MADRDVREAQLERIVSDAQRRIDDEKAMLREALSALRKYRREKAKNQEQN